YLGLALARLDDCRGAVPALEESNRQGRLKRGQQRELDRALSACRDRLAALRPPPPAAPPPAEPPPPVVTPSPTVPATDTEKDGSPPATELEEREATGDDATTTSEPSLAERRPPSGEGKPSTPELAADSPVPSQEPPPELRRAVEAFLDSEYARASRLLGSASFTAPKAKAAAHLLRAAAVYALYLEGGGEDGALLRLARLEAERWRAEPAGIRASAGAFSPPVLAFLEGDG
ncbi:MAG: hypothetical protein MI919_35280, partial [Holophagales bacterium]|nr:hypothetical protein [Holophagales bacterium]